MPDFTGNNDEISIRRLMLMRGNYQKFAYPERGGRGPKNVIDLNFGERVQYGKVDAKNDAVIARTSALKPITSTVSPSKTMMAQNFMADAFVDFTQHMQRACTLRVINNEHPYMSKVEPFRAYESPYKKYKEYMGLQISEFNDIFLRTSSHLDEVINFAQYCSQLLIYMKFLGEDFPLTFTGWQRSTNSNIFTSGLAIDIAGLDISDDAPKDQLFIKDPGFGFYLKLARYYGLIVAKNAPFILAADLSSPAMRKYLVRYELYNMDDVFSNNFENAQNMDVDLLKNLIVDGFNDFVGLYPYKREIRYCKNGATLSNIQMRKVVNDATVERTYGYTFFNNLYIEMRNMEERMPFAQPDLDRIKKNANVFHKKINPTRAWAYVNEQFRQLYKFKEGNLHSIKKKLLIKKKMKFNS